MVSYERKKEARCHAPWSTVFFISTSLFLSRLRMSAHVSFLVYRINHQWFIKSVSVSIRQLTSPIQIWNLCTHVTGQHYHTMSQSPSLKTELKLAHNTVVSSKPSSRAYITFVRRCYLQGVPKKSETVSTQNIRIV